MSYSFRKHTKEGLVLSSFVPLLRWQKLRTENARLLIGGERKTFVSEGGQGWWGRPTNNTHEEDIEDKKKVSVLEYSAAFPTTEVTVFLSTLKVGGCCCCIIFQSFLTPHIWDPNFSH